MKTMFRNLLMVVLLSPLAVWAIGPVIGPDNFLSWTRSNIDVLGNPVNVTAYRLLFTPISGDYTRGDVTVVDVQNFVDLPLVHIESFGNFRFPDGQIFCVVRAITGRTQSANSVEIPFVFQRIIPDVPPRTAPLSPTSFTIR